MILPALPLMKNAAALHGGVGLDIMTVVEDIGLGAVVILLKVCDMNTGAQTRTADCFVIIVPLCNGNSLQYQPYLNKVFSHPLLRNSLLSQTIPTVGLATSAGQRIVCSCGDTPRTLEMQAHIRRLESNSTRQLWQ